MGFDSHYCTKCKECLHDDYFCQCVNCYERDFDICDDCMDKKNFILKDLYICNYCIEYYKDDGEKFKEFFELNKQVKSKKNKNEFIKNIKMVQKHFFSIEHKINEIDIKINSLENEINDLKISKEKLIKHQ
jgi:hypothetical protein